MILKADHVVAIARTSAAAARLPDRARKLAAVNSLLPGGLTPRVREIRGDRIVMSQIPGEPIASQLSDNYDVERTLVSDLSSLLIGMRRVDLADARALGIANADTGRWQTFVDKVQHSLFPLMNPAGRDRAMRELASVVSLPQPVDCLVHGDLGGENLLFAVVNGVPRLSGVVDWDSVHIGDQATDLASLAATFGMTVVERIVAKMKLDGPILPRICGIRGTFALQQALSGFQDGDEAEMLDGLAGYI